MTSPLKCAHLIFGNFWLAICPAVCFHTLCVFWRFFTGTVLDIQILGKGKNPKLLGFFKNIRMMGYLG